MIYIPTDDEVVELTKNYSPRWADKSLSNLEGEYWVDFRDSGYQVSNFARIKGKKRTIYHTDGVGYSIKERILSQWHHRQGYLFVKMNTRDWLSHIVVGICFHKNPDNKPEINHRNLIKDCNEPWNLEWATKMENMGHAKSSGAMHSRPGEMSCMSILTNDQAVFISKSKISNIKLAEMFSVSRSTIERIKSGKQWSKITGVKYESTWMPKERVLEIFISEGTGREIAKKYNISEATVSRIKNKKLRSEITNNL